MSKRFACCAAVASIAGALGACTTLPVTVDMAPGYSVASCRSYTFADEHYQGGEHGAFGNPINGDRVRMAIQGQMYARGIPEVPRNQADCVVGYAIGTRQVIDQYYAGWGVGYGWGWRRGWWGYDEPWVYDETRVSIDFFDVRARKPIWHGAVSETASNLTGSRAAVHLSEAVAAIFSKLPLPPAGAVPPPGNYPPPPTPPSAPSAPTAPPAPPATSSPTTPAPGA